MALVNDVHKLSRKFLRRLSPADYAKIMKQPVSVAAAEINAAGPAAAGGGGGAFLETGGGWCCNPLKMVGNVLYIAAEVTDVVCDNIPVVNKITGAITGGVRLAATGANGIGDAAAGDATWGDVGKDMGMAVADEVLHLTTSGPVAGSIAGVGKAVVRDGLDGNLDAAGTTGRALVGGIKGALPIGKIMSVAEQVVQPKFNRRLLQLDAVPIPSDRIAIFGVCSAEIIDDDSTPNRLTQVHP